MNKKVKKIGIGCIIVLVLIVVGGYIGVSLYMDTVLNKLDQGVDYKEEDVGAKQIKSNVETIALFGIDKSEGDTAGRSDVMKLISLDSDKKKIKITSIQRDNLVYQPMKERYEKLNHAYYYQGSKGALSTINYNFDLNVTKYVKFDFESVEHIVDSIGGVDITLTSEEATSLQLGGAGIHHLSGKQTLSYSRIRNIDSDYGRMQRQNNVINAIMLKIIDTSPFALLDTVNNVIPYIETNVSNAIIKEYVMKLIGFDLGNVEQYQFPSEGYDSILTSLTLYGFGPHYVLKDFAGEVEKMHQNIYGNHYKASKIVKRVDQETKAMAGY